MIGQMRTDYNYCHIEACKKCANRIDSFSRLDKYNISVGIKTVSITFRVAVCIDAL